MSVSDQDADPSHEDDMPSVEVDSSEGMDEVTHSARVGGQVRDSEKQLEPNALAGDLDEAALELMTGSYSEILSPSHLRNDPQPEEGNKPSIQQLTMDGTVLKDGDMIHFIAKNLESKIRLSSPDISEASQCLGPQSDLRGNLSTTPESTLLAHLEREARNIAASVDGLTEHLAVSLHTISAVTAQSLTVYKDSVCKTCDAMDSNIKSMYQLMAKCEELSKSMSPIYKLSEQVKEIKKLLDIIENLS
uniref:EOG090X0FS7 n=1 Tax=Scapholeberis mucronata TaxID=202097 RepID=A0A4Y7NM89_9CRUS|nr:EOG090X0FS7 [Scapholeberis mucronata]